MYILVSPAAGDAIQNVAACRCLHAQFLLLVSLFLLFVSLLLLLYRCCDCFCCSSTRARAITSAFAHACGCPIARTYARVCML